MSRTWEGTEFTVNGADLAQPSGLAVFSPCGNFCLKSQKENEGAWQGQAGNPGSCPRRWGLMTDGVTAWGWRARSWEECISWEHAPDSAGLSPRPPKTPGQTFLHTSHGAN